MDSLTFISKLIESVIWPISITIVFLIFKKPIINALKLIKRLKVQDVEFEFGEEILDIEQNAFKSLTIDNNYSNLLDEHIYEKIQSLIDLSPKLGITEAWNEFEIAAITALKKQSKSLNNSYTFNNLLYLIQKNGLLNNMQINTLIRLNNLKHGFFSTERDVDIKTANTISHILLNYAENILNY